MFSAPIHPIFEDIANTFPSLLILAFADNSFFIGPRSQILQAADLYNTKIHELGLRLNPMESVIYAINCDPNHCPPSMTTPGGMVIPCTAHGITMLGAPLGTVSFVRTGGQKIMQKIESNLLKLKEFGHLHQRAKLATFCVNTQPTYFMGIVDADHFRDSLVAFDDSVDNFWADLLQFPDDFHRTNCGRYKSALQQLRLGIRDGGSGCYRNEPLLSVAQYSTVSATLKWCTRHPVNFTWLPVSIDEILKQSLQTVVPHVQQWGLRVAEAMPSSDVRNKKDIPLQIPSPDMVQAWPDHLFPTRGDFGRHIKSQLRRIFTESLHPRDLQRYQSVVRHKVGTHQRSHLQTESGNARGALWQCSTSLFSLNSFYELSNEALVHSTALLLGTPLPHALYLKAHVEKYANIDEWGDFLLNDPAHAGTSRKLTHDKFAKELSKTANECGMATTCKESQLPYRDQGRPDQSRKRADMMTFSGGCVRENQRLNFNKNTRLIMDVTIGHVFDTRHFFKRRNIQAMETKKRRKYAEHYQQQRLAFAPMVANTLGQLGPDCLQFLWILADNDAQIQLHPDLESLPNDITTQGNNNSPYSIDSQRQRGRKYHDNRLRLLTCIFEAVTERIFGATFHLSNSKHYRDWLKQTRHNWQTSIPAYDLSTQSTGSTFSSDAGTLSMAVDSSQAIPHSQNSRHVSTFSDHTLPLESPESLSFNPMETSGSPMPGQITTPTSAIVNYVINAEGGGYKRREVERLTLSLSSSDISETTRPARRRRIIHDPLSPLTYVHTPTNLTQNDSGHP